jgi:NADH-quinone oxidoreductase subunit C
MIDLSMIDYPERKDRFEIFYLLLSLKYNTRFVVTTFTKEGTYLDSVTNIYPAAG